MKLNTKVQAGLFSALLLATMGVSLTNVSHAQYYGYGNPYYNRPYGYGYGYGERGWGNGRNEVYGRDIVENREINRDAGHLDGQYGYLKAEDASIRRQERADLAQNGGYLTRGERYQLNAEENGLQRQINYDNSPFHIRNWF